jgi:hypothetical protein
LAITTRGSDFQPVAAPGSVAVDEVVNNPADHTLARLWLWRSRRKPAFAGQIRSASGMAITHTLVCLVWSRATPQHLQTRHALLIKRQPEEHFFAQHAIPV